MSDYFAETMTRITETKIKSRKQRERKQGNKPVHLLACRLCKYPVGCVSRNDNERIRLKMRKKVERKGQDLQGGYFAIVRSLLIPQRSFHPSFIQSMENDRFFLSERNCFFTCKKH